MSKAEAIAVSRAVETLLIRENHRFMAEISEALEPGYLLRAAEYLLGCSGPVYIVTGFPVNDTFETDGPAGAFALYRLCEKMGHQVVIITDTAIAGALQDQFVCRSIAGTSFETVSKTAEALYREASPGLVISIERPGMAADGRYYNMSGEDITAHCGIAEPYLVFAPCPTIAIGDGGNEIGMGNALSSLSNLNIRPAVSTCSELIVADVSNWGAYALCGMTRWLSGDHLPESDEFATDLDYLVSQGALDGVTREAKPTEDGFTREKTSLLLTDIRRAFTEGEAS